MHIKHPQENMVKHVVMSDIFLDTIGTTKKWLVVIQRGWDYSPHHSSIDGIFVWYQTWLVVEPPTPLKNMTNCQLA